MDHDDDNEEEPAFPKNAVLAKVLGFFEHGGEVKAIMHPCKVHHTDDDTTLTQAWSLHYGPQTQRDPQGCFHKYIHLKYDIVDVKSIYEQVLEVEEQPGLHEIAPKDKDD